MDKADHIKFWKQTSEIDWDVAQNLFEKANYPQALFFGHLVLEKLLKAHWVKDNVENIPPKIHNLVKLSEQTNLLLEPENINFLGSMNYYQMEGRYSDYKLKIYRLCTQSFTENLLEEINQYQQWLIKLL